MTMELFETFVSEVGVEKVVFKFGKGREDSGAEVPAAGRDEPC